MQRSVGVCAALSSHGRVKDIMELYSSSIPPCPLGAGEAPLVLLAKQALEDDKMPAGVPGGPKRATPCPLAAHTCPAGPGVL